MLEMKSVTEVSVPFWAMAHHRRSSRERSEVQASDRCGFVTLDLGYSDTVGFVRVFYQNGVSCFCF